MIENRQHEPVHNKCISHTRLTILVSLKCPVGAASQAACFARYAVRDNTSTSETNPALHGPRYTLARFGAYNK
jgi:hypothetical protein